ncbi:DUF2520 domain-containing protein [bacterium]|nr:DUF2520 domain-containing protein [bacterium]
MELHSLKIGFIGTGRVGTWLARNLAAAQLHISGLYDLDPERARNLQQQLPQLQKISIHASLAGLINESQLIFLTIPDDSLERVIADLAILAHTPIRRYYLHTSGYHSSRILAPLRSEHTAVLSLHPCRSITWADTCSAADTAFVLEGDDQAVTIGLEIVSCLKGRAFRIQPEQKPIYHLGAALLSNFTVSMFYQVVKLYEQIGVDSEQAHALLVPLLVSTLTNIEQNGVDNALTGPIARGDLKTVRGHLQLIRQSAPPFAEAMKHFFMLTVDMARQNGYIESNIADQLRKEVEE